MYQNKLNFSKINHYFFKRQDASQVETAKWEDRDSVFPSTGSLLLCQQQPGLGQPKPGARNSTRGSLVSEPTSAPCPESAHTGSRTGSRARIPVRLCSVRCGHPKQRLHHCAKYLSQCILSVCVNCMKCPKMQNIKPRFQSSRIMSSYPTVLVEGIKYMENI